MNLFELLKKGTALLEEKGIEDADFDAKCLLEYVFEIDRNQYFLKRFDKAVEDKKEEFLSLIERRSGGEPLQYIIGKWGFMNGEFFVGEGVLIPRADTEILVESAVDFIKSHSNVRTVYDLCSGSGCVGISIAMMCPDVQVFCVELSDYAFEYLQKNITLNNVKNVIAVKGDITKGYESFCSDKIDVLVSNPPYIESDEIRTLSIEVQNEPHMALDGGTDGFDFYRVIGEKWLSYMNKGSFAAFECGETQAEKLAELYADFSAETNIINDLNGIQRVVSIIKN